VRVSVPTERGGSPRDYYKKIRARIGEEGINIGGKINLPEVYPNKIRIKRPMGEKLWEFLGRW